MAKLGTVHAPNHPKVVKVITKDPGVGVGAPVRCLPEVEQSRVAFEGAPPAVGPPEGG